MNKLFALAGAAVLFGTGMVGCSNTADGAAKDASNDAAAVKNTADVAAAKTVQGTEKAVAATEKGAADAAAATEKAAANAAATTEKAAADVAAGTEKAAANVAVGTEKVAADVAAGTAKAVGDAKQSVKHAGKVVSVTPKVKAALLNDKTLYPDGAATHSSINVDMGSDGATVHLKGMVSTNEDKKKAEQIAKDAVKDESTPYHISNELTVGKH